MPKRLNLRKYTSSQINFFVKEIKEAGGFDELMISKKALEKVDERYSIITYQNTKEYKEKYLKGKYRSLRPFFNTKVPYSFWSQLYIALRRSMYLSK